MERPLDFSRFRRWAGSGLYLAINNLTTASFPLIFSIVLTRLLSQSEYGTYSLFISVILILDFTSLTGVGTALIRATARGLTGTLPKATATRIKFSLTGGAFLLVLAAYRATSGEVIAPGMLVVMGLLFPFYFPFTNFQCYLVGLRDFRRLLRFQTIHLVASYLPMFVVALLTSDYRAVLLVHIVIVPCVRYLLYKKLEREVPVDAPVDPEFLHYGKHISMVSLMGSLEAHLDRILLGTFFSTTALSTFHVGKSIGYQGRFFWNIIYQYVFPTLSKRLAEHDKGFPRVLFGVMAIHLLALGAGYLITPLFVDLFYTERYAASTITARWFFLAAALGSPAAVFDTYFLAANLLSALWIAKMTKTGIYLGSLYFFVSRFGIDGFYYAVVVSRIVHSLVDAVLVFTHERNLSGRNVRTAPPDGV